MAATSSTVSRTLSAGIERYSPIWTVPFSLAREETCSSPDCETEPLLKSLSFMLKYRIEVRPIRAVTKLPTLGTTTRRSHHTNREYVDYDPRIIAFLRRL